MRKDYRHSQETKNKISNAHIGKKREPFSIEWKNNMSKSRMGKKRVFSEQGLKNILEARNKTKGIPRLWSRFKRSKETRLKMSGDKHWNWKGGIYPKNESIRHSLEYKDWRNKIFNRDGYKCQMIKSATCDKSDTKLQAHHIKPFRSYPELRFDLNNGITLCEKCHNKLKYKEWLEERFFLAILEMKL